MLWDFYIGLTKLLVISCGITSFSIAEIHANEWVVWVLCPLQQRTSRRSWMSMWMRGWFVEYLVSCWYGIWLALLCRAFFFNACMLCILSELNALPIPIRTQVTVLCCFYFKLIWVFQDLGFFFTPLSKLFFLVAFTSVCRLFCIAPFTKIM